MKTVNQAHRIITTYEFGIAPIAFSSTGQLLWTKSTMTDSGILARKPSELAMGYDTGPRV